MPPDPHQLPWIGAVCLLAPLALWDIVLWLLRRRGDRDPARRDQLLRHFSPEELAAGRTHVLRHNRLFPLSRVLYYLFFGALLFGGAAARLEGWALGVAGGLWALALPLFVFLLVGLRTLLWLPLSAYRELVIQRQAGLSTIRCGTWLADRVKELVLGTVLASAAAYPVVALLRALPDAWPLPASAAVLALSAFTTWISPWIIAPLFNRFWPLAEQCADLEQRVRHLAGQAGLAVHRVYVTDASRRSRLLNAYFTGLGSSRRVVLFDTLVRECDPAEVLSVVAHELGHLLGRHIAKLFWLQAAGTLFALGLLKLVLDSPTCRGLLGLPAPDSLVLLVLLPFLAGPAGLVISPLVSALSRRFERESDRTALRLTGDPAGFIRLMQRIVRRARADLLVHRLLQLLYGGHPLPEERIATAESRLPAPGRDES